MPISKLYLPCELYEDHQIEVLANTICKAKAEILESPLDRIRVFVADLPLNKVSIGGQIGVDKASAAPFYEIYLLEGRPLAQQQSVMTSMASLISEILEVDKSVIRGICHSVPPALWAIGGVPAASIRAGEIERRASENN